MKRTLSMALAAALTMSLAGCGGNQPAATTAAPSAAPAAAEKPQEEKTEGTGDTEAAEPVAEDAIVLKFADTEVPGMPEYEGNLYFIDLVEKNSGGRIKIEYYPNNQLGGDKEITGALMAGTVDIGKCAAGNLADWTDAAAFTDIPGVYKNAKQMRAVWQSDLRQEVTEKIKADTGLTPVMFDCDGGAARALFYNGNKEIHVPEDCKGLKFRTTGSDIEMALFKQVGIAPTPMAFTELYTGLQQGTIDGIYTHPAGTYGNKLCEVTKYCTIINLSYITTFKLLSEKAVEKLGGEGSELYNIVVEAGREAEVHKDKLIEEKNQEIEQLMTDEGVTIIKVTDEEQKLWNEAAQAIWPEFIGEGKTVDQALFDKVAAME